MFSQLREDVQSVFGRDPAARTTLEVRDRLGGYARVHAEVFLCPVQKSAGGSALCC